ncbi:LAFA_0A03972g1_1 [Lachancea sp. 'fantastica']|nr:LAFA_0A03972g1_1 [Lachancea sp. 'fantastica']
MALHNYIYLKHKSHDPECHTLIAREHDTRPVPQRMVTLDTDNGAPSTTPAGKNDKNDGCCGDCQGNCSGEKSKKLAEISW